MLEFRILGPLEVLGDSGPLPLGGQKQRALLALLLLGEGRVVSTDRLLDALWGEHPPRTATTSLQNLISALRRMLGAETVVTQPPGYVLRVEPGSLDLARFEALVEQARGRPPAERANVLREALALWRGSPLADLAFEGFAGPEILRLEEFALTVLEERIQADLDAGRHTELVGELSGVLRENPLREGLYAKLMLALYRSRRQAEALDVYQAARRALVDGLGLEPSPELQQLHGRILRQEAGLDLEATQAPVEDHFREVVRELLAGRVVPVLGADVGDLARRLAERFDYPVTDDALTRVSQYVAVMRGSGPLYEELHALLEADAVPTPVHRFFAALPVALRERGLPHQLLVTTSYDLALEQAFLDAGEEFDVVFYLAAGRDRGRFCHLAPDGTATPIAIPNTYTDRLSLERRTVILKLHGRLDRSADREWESFVVTEDDYIDYLAQSDVSGALPVGLTAKLRRSHFLFLGYSMSDWNLRVILNRLWGDNALSYRSWAVQPEAKLLEREFWRRREVDVVELGLEAYVEALARQAGLVSAEARA
ncbi:MAG TPA: BTAD domain-containing putative transcriptional regulator [Gaiellaceae bacterium]